MSWVVIEKYENLDVWETQFVWGPFRTERAAERYEASRKPEMEEDWRISLEVQEVVKPA